MQHGIKRVQLSEHAKKAKLEKDRAKIAYYRNLTKNVLSGKKQKLYTAEALEGTTTILDLNPEFNAVWNYRRSILTHLLETGEIDRRTALYADLHISMEMMKRFPKCYWIWNHRRWCLETLEAAQLADWSRELAIALKVLQMDSRNFHGWQYRRYVVSQMEKVGAAELAINLREFQYTTEVINKSTANFSAWHNRTKLIIKIFLLLGRSGENAPAPGPEVPPIFASSSALLKHELNLVKTGMFMDADDTSVWLYMQWLLTEETFVKGLSEGEYEEILQQQLRDVRELNALEKEDSLTGSENVWCLKTIIFLLALLQRKLSNIQEGTPTVDAELARILNLLVELDPLRKGRYVEQLSGKASIIC